MKETKGFKIVADTRKRVRYPEWFKRMSVQAKAKYVLRFPGSEVAAVGFQELAAGRLPDWFEKMTEDQQQKYLDSHPKSKLSLSLKGKAPKSDRGRDTEKEVRDAKDDERKKIMDHKSGSPSPTNFLGPKDDSGSAFNNPEEERKVVKIVTDIARIAEKYKKAGKEFPDLDLCEVTIPGTNLFCEVNKGIPRKRMPQLKGTPAEGTWAAKNLKANDEGEVNAEKEFIAHLREKGIKVKGGSMPATEMKSTQSQLVGSKVAGMFEALKENPKHPGISAPLFVSSDGYVLDGHHRWAAKVMYDIADGVKDPVNLDVVIVDMPISELVNETNEYTQMIGIASKDNVATAAFEELARQLS